MPQAMTTPDDRALFARIEPPCRHFGSCGGCALQDLAYPDQLALKQRRLHQRIAQLGGGPMPELTPLEDPWRYRNKAEFTFSEAGGRLILGYHAAGSFFRVVNLEECLLLPPAAVDVLRDFRALAAETGLPAYHPRRHEGFFRYFVVRASRATGRVMVCLITTSPPAIETDRVRRVVDAMAEALMQRQPALAGFHWGLTDRPADVASPESLLLVRGETDLEERIGPLTIRVHPLSFLQASTVQADRMYRVMAAVAQETRPAVAWDVYCGLGVVGLYLAPFAGRVYGVEADAGQLELAARNASLNRTGNLEFRAGRAEEVLGDRRFWLQEARPGLVVVDPPRAGLHARVVDSVLAARPERLAYCSCNADSLARDLRLLTSSYPRYRIAQWHAFDMFPQTNHVETLTLLDRQR